MSNKKTERIEHQFTPVYDRLLQVGSICGVVTDKDSVYGKEVCIKWDIYSTVIYSYLLKNFKFFNKTRLTLDNISANTGCSKSTLKRRLKDMEELGIIKKDVSKSFGGSYNTTLYTNVVELLNNPRFKLKSSEYFENYMNTIKDRKKKMEVLREYPIKRSWTTQQAINYWRNINYELRTGIYLKGDKTEKLWYVEETKEILKHNTTEGFQSTDELKGYEINQLLNNATYEEDEENF